MTGQKKLDGVRRDIYVWNDSGASRFVNRPRETASQAKPTVSRRFSNLALAILTCAALIVCVFYWLESDRASQLDEAIQRQRSLNESVSDEIGSLETTIADSLTYDKIVQRAAEDFAMIKSSELNGVTVYVPNHGTSTLTANAGGRK